jgi:small subunit ribosomal protein S17
MKMEEKKKEKKVMKSLVSTRGRIFQGEVIKKFENRAVIEFTRTVYIPKYERFSKKKTKLHARIPEDLKVEVGDYVKIRECRPLSKIVNFMIIETMRGIEK